MVVVVGRGYANGIGRLVPQNGVQRLRRGRKGRRLRVRSVVHRDVHRPDDPENRPRVSPLDLERKLLIVRHERDAVPQRAEPVSEFGQRTRDVKGARDAEGVSDQPVQVERVGVIRVVVVVVVVVVGRHKALDDVDEVREEHAVAVREVGVEDVLRDVQLAHDDVAPELVAFLHAGGDGGGHALRGDGDVWVVVVAVCLRKKPDVE